MTAKEKKDTRYSIVEDLADMDIAPVHNSLDHQAFEELIYRAQAVLKKKPKKQPFKDPRQMSFL